MLAILFFVFSYIWFLIATHIDSQPPDHFRRILGLVILKIILMSSLIILFLWIGGKVDRISDDRWFWDEFFILSGPIIAGFIADITSKSIHIPLISCLTMSVIVSLLISIFWAQGLSEFQFVFLYLIAFTVIGMIPARITRRIRRRIIERKTPPWAP